MLKGAIGANFAPYIILFTMSKKINKRFILTDESVNRYGYRVLTAGIQNLEAWKKNPILMWCHYRDEGGRNWDYKPIGHWEDIEINEKNELTAIPVFDCVDDLSKVICQKVEEGTLNACSIGFRIIETSDDPSVIVYGQKRATVTKWDLMEVSIVDIPANGNAVRLYSHDTLEVLSAGDSAVAVPIINHLNSSQQPMKLKATFEAILCFLGIGKDVAETTDFTEADLLKVNDELARLRGENEQLSSANAQLVTDHTAALAAKDAEIATLTNEVSTLKTSNQTLTDQVAALQANPADGKPLAPAGEPSSTTSDPNKDFLDFCSEHPDDTIAQMKKMKELGFVKQ